MKIRLPKVTKAYDAANETDNRRAIEQALGQIEGKTEDVYITRGRRLFIQDDLTGAFVQLGVSGGVPYVVV